MNITCPACNAEYSLDVLIAHEGARDAVMAALKLPAPLGGLLLRYLSLFRTAKTKNLSWDKVARVLGDLVEPVAKAEILFDGRTWPAPLPYWHQALEYVVNNTSLKPPLSNHNYLYKVIAGITGEQQAKAEDYKEQQRRTYGAPGEARTGGFTHVSSAMPDEVRAKWANNRKR